MKILNNKRGVSLPFVLGIMLFIVTSTIILVTSVTAYNIQIENSYQRTEAYINAQNTIAATAEIIIRDQDLTSDYLDDLATHMEVNISSSADDILLISREISDIVTVTSYLKTIASESTYYDMYESFLNYSGLENDYQKDPFLTPAVILSSYLDTFLNETFSSNTYNENFNDFQSIFDFMKALALEGNTYTIEDPDILESQNNPTVSGHWYIDGNVTLSNDDDLVVPDGYLLFIDGNLKMKKRSEINGNIVVNGNVYIDSNQTNASLSGTVYASGNFTTETTFDLGTFWEPSFIIIDGDFRARKYMDGYGYIIADEAKVNKKKTNINIIGGVYADSIVNLDSSEVSSNYWSWYVGLEGTAVPEKIEVVTDGGLMVYTNPS